jgi:hypothetical protein
MKDLKTWLHANGLVINTKKTIAMPFYTQQNKLFLKPQIRFDRWILNIIMKQNFWVYI